MEVSNQIFNYKCKEFVQISHSKDSTCEEICIILCKQIGILPSARLLFGLRIHETKNWLALCSPLKTSIKYEFRIRYRVPQLSRLKKLDEITYDYFYHQSRYDLVKSNIPEMNYPLFKEQVLGLTVIDMIIDMMELKYSIEHVVGNYEKYNQKKLIEKHKKFAQKLIDKNVREKWLKFQSHDIFYVKGEYLNSIEKMAPDYLNEEFNGYAEYLPEDDLKQGYCPIRIQLNLIHATEPGLRVFYQYKNEWKHIVRIDKIYAINRESNHCVRLEISDLPNGYRLQFSKSADLETFISYVTGYYRLTVKWMLDLCLEYETPSLLDLKILKCHGPIGGEFSYSKIREKNKNAGSYIVRQCEREFDAYYIDINTRSSQTETFKITREGDKWNLHMQDCVTPFNKLTDLALNIETSSEHKFRIPPSEYDKPPLLLICLPKNQVTIKKTVGDTTETELQRKRVQIIDPKIDLQWYKNSQKDCEGGKMFKMTADWILPSDMHMKVNLKVLKSEKNVMEFMKLANNWSKMYSPEFLKLYGLTLSTPHTMVMEYSKFALNEILSRYKTHVTLLCLLEAVHGLVRAIVYLQENDIMHGFIRCSTLQVVRFDPKTNTLVAKLADPGFPKPYKKEDLPWIPFEYHKNLEDAKIDSSAEFWAFATTVWEIFARGKSIDKFESEELRQNYSCWGGILPVPEEDCPDEMYETMLDGWCSDPDKRFNQQLIFSRLASIKEQKLSDYSRVQENGLSCGATTSDSTSLRSRGSSNRSAFTDETVVNGSSGSEQSLNSMNENFYDKTPLINHRRRNNSNNSNTSIHPMYPQSYFDVTPSILKINDGKVIYKEKIGEGHYGTVYRGELHFNDDNKEPIQVAIKTLKANVDRRSFNQDFMREIQIMKSLNHPNIVKILRWIDKPQISIIMEYIECGSFIVYLSSKKPNLTNEKLLKFAMDIAKGMDYLRNKSIIHRDLAARNILVDGDHVKISDFGLAQVADSDGYYFVKSDREIPIKWYSPETIKTNKFSFQSDVWSYGITLFEMFSRGGKPDLVPNTELRQTEILDRLEKGERLGKPIECTINVYEQLMLPCWHENPKRRPNFKEIIDIIDVFLKESGECI